MHPALYCYAHGISKLKLPLELPLDSEEPDTNPELPAESFCSSCRKVMTDPHKFCPECGTKITHGKMEIVPGVFAGQKDVWGRPHETSIYQWLPSYFSVSPEGRVTIEDYINNLVPRSQYEGLYSDLARLFEHALPLVEAAYAYGVAIRKRMRDEGEEMDYDDGIVLGQFPIVPQSLRGKRLQVIPKIVDYELGPGEKYEGVWHVEGMSHENIVCTAELILDRDPELEGANLLYKRAFLREEAEYIFSHVGQERHIQLDKIVEQGLLPLGRAATPTGRLLVFPNSHVHKVSPLVNTQPVSADGKKAIRRIVVFFVVDPSRRIVSTREVPPQQEDAGGMMSREQALDLRLKLMHERKFQKQDWNVREIELCEH